MTMILKFLFADKFHFEFKERLIADFLQTLPYGESLLDVGAGQMPYRKYCDHLRYTSQDFCKYDGKGDGTGVQTGKFNTQEIDIVSDVAEIPLPSGSQDNILSTEVLEHVVNPLKVIAEMARLLRPGGGFLITVPGTSLLHFSPYHYYTGFKENFFKTTLHEQGLRINRIVRVGSIFSVTALNLWFIAESLAKTLFPWRPGPVFKLFLIGFSPLIIMLLLLHSIKRIDPGSLEAGIVVIGKKAEEL